MRKVLGTLFSLAVTNPMINKTPSSVDSPFFSEKPSDVFFPLLSTQLSYLIGF